MERSKSEQDGRKGAHKRYRMRMAAYGKVHDESRRWGRKYNLWCQDLFSRIFCIIENLLYNIYMVDLGVIAAIRGEACS